MNDKRTVLSRIWLVIEVLYLAAVLYLFGDTLALVLRGAHLTRAIIVVALAILIPGGILVKGYLDYAKGLDSGRNKILGAAAASAVLFGLRFVPGLNTFLLGVNNLPAFQMFNLRILNLTFGPGGSNHVFTANLIAQAVVPIVLIALCEGFSFAGKTAGGTNAGSSANRLSGRSLGSAVLRVVLTVAAVWAAYAATIALIKSRTFDHSWLIVGFVPIPGQIMLALPAVVALGVVITIWTKPWTK